MSKPRESKLDEHAERLTEWLTPKEEGGRGLTYHEAAEQLRSDSFSVVPSRICTWWKRRRDDQEAKDYLEGIRNGSAQVKEVEQALGENRTPELETLIQMHRLVVLQLVTQSKVNPKLLKTVSLMMKPIMEYAKLAEKRKEIELNQQKYLDHVAERKRVLAAEIKEANTSGGLSQEARAKIERELNLL